MHLLIIDREKKLLDFNITVAMIIDVIINFEFNDFLFIFVPVVSN